MSYKNKINWQAFSNKERHESIEELKSIISENDGFIMAFTMYSDLALNLSIEIEENKIPNLYTSLLSILIISESKPKIQNSHSTKEWLILLNVSFSKGEGKLRQSVPMVPG